jgi:3-phosphoshikimate 1-carboxyvinyltransferase
LDLGSWIFNPVPLPELIEIVPLEKPVHAEISVPGSKSITNRALILAALSQGETTLRGALWSEDTQVMVEALRALGFGVEVADEPLEICNRTITVRGLGGRIPRGGTLEAPLEIFVGNAGTAARFLTALVCLGQGIYRIHGVNRMHERPQEALFDALRELGYCIDSVNDKLPATVHGTGPRAGNCCVSIAHSSQFASALLLCREIGKWSVTVVGENTEESPYVAMTAQLIETFPKRGGDFQVEPDASSCSYFWAADGLMAPAHQPPPNCVVVQPFPSSGWQIDARFFNRAAGSVVSRANDLGDSIMTAIVIAPFDRQPVKFVELGRLRVQECERVVALRTELTRCGAKVIEQGDTLTVYPSALHGAEIETYHDHRMAMCFAILGLKLPGIKIKNPGCVKKTFPNFFQKLATPPPHGLGATVLDARAGRRLAPEELFAD